MHVGVIVFIVFAVPLWKGRMLNDPNEHSSYIFGFVCWEEQTEQRKKDRMISETDANPSIISDLLSTQISIGVGSVFLEAVLSPCIFVRRIDEGDQASWRKQIRNSYRKQNIKSLMRLAWESFSGSIVTFNLLEWRSCCVFFLGKIMYSIQGSTFVAHDLWFLSCSKIDPSTTLLQSYRRWIFVILSSSVVFEYRCSGSSWPVIPIPAHHPSAILHTFTFLVFFFGWSIGERDVQMRFNPLYSVGSQPCTTEVVMLADNFFQRLRIHQLPASRFWNVVWS